MRTPGVTPASVTHQWHVIDAKDAVLGRLASRVAHVLRGKHKATFQPHQDMGDFVIILNADKVRFTGKKESDKIYWTYTGYPGGERPISVEKERIRYPDRIVTHAVKGMLPKGKLGRKMVKKLKVYAGEAHPHAAQQPVEMKL